MRSLPPLPWRTRSRRSAQAQSARSRLDRLGAADAGVQQREEDRAITAAHHRGGVAAGEQAGDLRGAQRRHDRAGQPHVAQAPERVVGGVAGRAQPVPEAAHLAEVAVAGIGAVGA